MDSIHINNDIYIYQNKESYEKENINNNKNIDINYDPNNCDVNNQNISYSDKCNNTMQQSNSFYLNCLPMTYPDYEEKYVNILPYNFIFNEDDYVRRNLPPFNYKFFEEDNDYNLWYKNDIGYNYDINENYNYMFNNHKQEASCNKINKNLLFNIMKLDGVCNIETTNSNKRNNIAPCINNSNNYKVKHFKHNGMNRISPDLFTSDNSNDSNIECTPKEDNKLLIEEDIVNNSNVLLSNLEKFEKNLCDKSLDINEILYDNNDHNKIQFDNKKLFISKLDLTDSNIKKNFSFWLKFTEKYISGAIISIMYTYNKPITTNEIKSELLPNFKNLRKSNGSKYNNNIEKVILSTLTSSKIFYRCNQLDSNLEWYFKENEALEYVANITNKEIDKALNNCFSSNYNMSKTSLFKLNSNNKLNNKSNIATTNDISNESNFSKNNINQEFYTKKRNKNTIRDIYYKKIHTQIVQVYKILDFYFSKGSYNKDKCREDCKKMFNCIKDKSLYFLKEVGKENSNMGIIMCFKFFKSLSKTEYLYFIKIFF